MRITLREVPDLVAALAVAGAVEVALRVLPLPRVARAVGAPLRLDGTAGTAPWVPARLEARGHARARAVGRVMRRWPFGDTCLRHALVAGRRLRRYRPRLVVGVTKVDGEVRAHAWLELESGVLDPLGAAPAYLPLEPSRPVEER